VAGNEGIGSAVDQGLELARDTAVGFGVLAVAEAAGDLLLDLVHAQVALHSVMPRSVLCRAGGVRAEKIAGSLLLRGLAVGMTGVRRVLRSLPKQRRCARYRRAGRSVEGIGARCCAGPFARPPAATCGRGARSKLR